MKIGILTLPLHTNYGGILQAYALTQVLSREGNQVSLLDKKRYPNIPSYRKPLIYTKRFLKKFLMGDKKTIVFLENQRRKEHSIIGQNTDLFISEYIHNRITFESFGKLSPTDFDAIIVGSDQIWRPKYVKRIEDSFLKFAERWAIRRIAYAPSFGTDEWEFTENQTQNCKSLLQSFNAISVREESGVMLCREYFNVTATLAPDPTMLLKQEDYIKIIKTKYPEPEQKDLFTYILDIDKEKEQVVKKVANTFKYKIDVGSTDDPHAPLERRIAPPVEDWLNSFYNSKFIITDSFHACVFSILFNKPFIAYGNQTRGLSRFHSLLKTFHLEERLILSPTDLSERHLTADINWTRVNKILDKNRTEALKFLNENLN